jgi:nucleoside-diphosphate-sugar epimerase
MKKYNVLITGGLGLIGTHVARNFANDKNVKKVICLDHFGKYINPSKNNIKDYRSMRSEYIGKKLLIERGESKFTSVINNILLRYKPKIVIHLAALPLAKLENLNVEEALEGSVQSTSYIIESIANLKRNLKYDFSRFVYASSSMIYGDFKKNVIDENHPTNPKEIYGTTKLAGEILTKGLCEFYNIDFSIVRPSAVYGPTDMNNRVTQIFLDKAIKDETINIQGKDEKLDFTYVKDIAWGFYLAAVKPGGKNQAFNITYGHAQKLIDYVLVLKKYFPRLKYKITARDKFRPRRGTLSIKKAQKFLGYNPKFSLNKGVKEYINFKKKYES